jgi:hypothetical protein
MSEARIDRPERRFDAIDDRLRRRIKRIVTRIEERLAATLPGEALLRQRAVWSTA